jgi:hypothetical protein
MTVSLRRELVSKQSIIESLIFLGFTLGVFLPVRLITFTYVSTWWFGSFGFITLTLIIILYLVKKNKLGWVGRIWQKKIHKLARGKLGVVMIAQSLFFILIFGNIVYLTDINRGTDQVEILKGEMEIKGVDNFQTLMVESAKTSSSASIEDWFRVVFIPR